MTNKRIQKTLEEVQAENEFASLHQALNSGTAAGQPEFEEEDTEEETSFEDLATAADELLTTEPAFAPRARRDRRASRNHELADNSMPGVTPMVMSGAFVTLGGFCLSVVSMVSPNAGGRFIHNLNDSGLTPGLIVTMGILILAVSAIMRRQNRFFSAHLQRISTTEGINGERLDFLIDTQQQQQDRRPASGEELEQVLHTLIRQDEKINNLTKALKMYGKPLVDVTRQTTENGQRTKAIAEQIEDLTKNVISPLSKHVESLHETLGGPIEATVNKGTQEVVTAVETISKQLAGDLAKAVDTMPKDNGHGDILQTLEQELGRLHNAINSIQVTPSLGAPAPSTLASSPSPSKSSSPQANSGPEPSGPATQISGAAKSSGKSVLGAIEKLRRMR